jgi:hypothetical protein
MYPQFSNNIIFFFLKNRTALKDWDAVQMIEFLPSKRSPTPQKRTILKNAIGLEE